MAFEPQRFIHAANVRLDVPISVHTAEVLTEELRRAFEDATLQAFDAVIDACISRDVDFLLLSGNVFVEADRSLRARLMLLKGLNRLDEHSIPVFAIPGDTDPPEAWRSIPEMPHNVTVCYSSSPEPTEFYISDHLAATVSTSMWLGETDDFGIRVIAEGGEGVRPFRIGVISQAKYEEARRMALLATAGTDDLPAAVLKNVASGETVETPGQFEAADAESGGTKVWRSIDVEDGQRPRRAAESPRRSLQRSLETLEAGPEDSPPAVDPGFVRYADELLREGQLNYLVLTGELARTTLWRDYGVVHCPGTTQPRSQMEASGGACSFVEVAAAGEVRITSLDSSCVDWKQIEVRVDPHITLTGILQQMKLRLSQLKAGAADRFWSVQWTLRGPLPVLDELARNDLDVAAAVELDELQYSGRTIRLLHEIRSLPDEWPADDPPTALADQFQTLAAHRRLLSDDALQAIIDRDRQLSAAWKQRLTSLLVSLDPERILARLRTDGASWFHPDFGLDELAPGSDFDESAAATAGESSDQFSEHEQSEQNDSDDDSEDFESSANA